MKLQPSAEIKGLSLLLCLLMLSSAVVSCSENKTENAGETSPSTTDTAPADPGESESDETTELSPVSPRLVSTEPPLRF